MKPNDFAARHQTTRLTWPLALSLLLTLGGILEGPNPVWGQDTAAPATQQADSKGQQKVKEEPEPKPTRVRLITLSGNYVDLVQPISLDPTSLLLGTGSVKQKPFYSLLTGLQELAENDEFAHVVFDLSDMSLSLNSAQLDELLRTMKAFKANGKSTYAWLENAGPIQLTIASACDHVVMTDFGGLDMPSSSMSTMFYRDAMDLAGIRASVVRAGDFKGAVEPYTNSVMSAHLRDHYQRMLQTLNAATVDRIAKGRGLTADVVRECQKQRLLTPEEALQHQLVDQLAPFGSMRSTLAATIDGPVEWVTPESKPRKQMSFFELMGRIMSGSSTKNTRTDSKDKIVVLHLAGTIVDGKKSASGNMVSGPTVDEIEKLIQDESVKGVVVRINSPGGSATASEAIRQALDKLAKSKPTATSMGSTAASGGYWISCIDAPVFAERGTVTGSIGVFALKLTGGTLMRRLGVHVETIGLDESAAFSALDQEWSESQKERVAKSIDLTYDRFLKLVAEYRGLRVEDVKPLAGGRVWSGSQAKAMGLVDRIGGVDSAIQLVAKRGKLQEYEVVHRPTTKQGLDLLDLLGSDEEEPAVRLQLRSLVQAFQALGFETQTTETLIRDSIRPRAGLPTQWLLQPFELRLQ